VKGYLVSGLPPGAGGLGRFLSMLAPLAEKKGWTVLCRPQSKGRGIVLHGLDLVRFYARLRFIRNADVLVLHPQTLRWRSFFNLVGSNRVTHYVVDSSFFCIRSYNYRGQKWEECLDCLGDVSRCHPSCHPFPVFYNRSRNLSYLSHLKKVAPGIMFLLQNPNQGRLIRKHFGSDVRVRLVGMVTDEFEGVEREKPGSGGFDVVFHGAINAAKGAGYAIELARHLPELSFLLPGSMEEATIQSGDVGLPGNVKVMDITWETGLHEEVENCRLVLCPSMWSAPIEGALVKSILHNGRVAVFNTEFGYQADLPEDLVIRLSPDLGNSAAKIRERLKVDVKEDLISGWIEELLSGTDLGSIFS
jgi:hypothetical protein